MRTGLFILLLAVSGCSYTCDATTCSTGCCQGGSCYEGAGKSGGVSCDSSSSGGGTFGTGGGGGGSLGAGGGGGSCGLYDDPCNASLPCCQAQPGDTLGHVCNSTRERCDLCGAQGYDCTDSSSEPCCPGYSCQLKPGFSSVYECQ